MFVIDPQLGHVEVTRERVVSFIGSVNQPHVAIPGHSPQPAQAWVTAIRNLDASFSIFVYLFLKKAQQPAIYVYQDRQFPLERYRDIEAEALNFVESMGFMMENANFRKLSREQQEDLLSQVPVFSKLDTAADEDEEGALEVDQRGQRLARLLAAF